MICPHCKRSIENSLQITGVVKKSDLILEAICEHFGVTMAELKGKKRYPEFVKARHAACFFLRKWCNLPHTSIARLFNKTSISEHTFSIYGEKKVRECLEMKDWIYQDIKHLDKVCEAICFPEHEFTHLQKAS
jgi:chromosomal replication initiation ATPase DnaA